MINRLYQDTLVKLNLHLNNCFCIVDTNSEKKSLNSILAIFQKTKSELTILDLLINLENLYLYN